MTFNKDLGPIGCSNGEQHIDEGYKIECDEQPVNQWMVSSALDHLILSFFNQLYDNLNVHVLSKLNLINWLYA